MEKCIGCELCAGVCPADCIYVRGLDNPPDDPVSPGERYGYVYEINYLRCIHCDLCVEACPTEAITESKLFEFSFTNRSDAIYTKKRIGRERRRHAQEAPVGGLARGRGPHDVRLDARHVAGGERGLRGRGPVGGRARLRRARFFELRSGRRDDDATGTKPLRETLEAHLLDEDIPLAHRGMQGRVWRAKKGAERNRRKMDAMRAA